MRATPEPQEGAVSEDFGRLLNAVRQEMRGFDRRLIDLDRRVIAPGKVAA